MFFTKKREKQLIDFLAQLMAISGYATLQQMNTYLDGLSTRSLEVANRFLDQWANYMPHGGNTNNRSNSRD